MYSAIQQTTAIEIGIYFQHLHALITTYITPHHIKIFTNFFLPKFMYAIIFYLTKMHLLIKIRSLKMFHR